MHFARWNGEVQPLEVWARDKQEWQGWQEYRPGRDDFNRPYIFSLVQFYHETDIWLFGGVFRVLACHEDRYEVELTDVAGGFLGRLKLRSPYRGRTTRANFENHYSSFEVQEVLREPYSGRSFPGYEDVDISFDELETSRSKRPTGLEGRAGKREGHLSDYRHQDRSPLCRLCLQRARDLVEVVFICSERTRREHRVENFGQRPVSGLLPDELSLCSS